MTDQQNLERLLSKLQERAKCEHCIDERGDDYNPGECKNYDDAFDDGRWHGEIEFARELLRYVETLNQLENN